MQKLPRSYQWADERGRQAQNTVFTLEIMVFNNSAFFLFHIGAGFCGFAQTASNAFTSNLLALARCDMDGMPIPRGVGFLPVGGRARFLPRVGRRDRAV